MGNTTDIDMSIFGNIPEIFKRIFRNFSMNFECCLPAVVDSYDRAKNLVTVIPAVNRLKSPDTPDGDPIEIQRAKMTVNAIQTYGGNIGITYPLKKGDTGWIIASDRDSSIFKQNRGIAKPLNLDFHSYQYGVFLPDRIMGFVVAEEDNDALTIQSLDGKTRISIQDNRIKHTVGSITMEITPTGIIINGPVTISGPTTITNTLTAKEVIFNGIAASSHKHTGIQRGSGTTDGPVS